MWKRDTSFKIALRNVNLTPLQQSILEQRYINVLAGMKRRCFLLSIYFNVSRFIVTVGSLIVPALLSIQYTGSTPGASSASIEIYWATWVISLLVTTSNGVVNMFKIDKKYYFLHTTYEHLRSEGWQYLELSGKYSGFYSPNEKPTHENQFIFFCHSVEKIKMKQIEEEYYKLTESHTTATAAITTTVANTGSSEAEAAPKEKNLDSLIPPTPLKPILDTLQSLPPELIRELLQKKSLATIEEDAQQRQSETETKSPRAAAQGRVPVSIVLSETTDAE